MAAEWTQVRDARLRRMRAEGAGWPEIGLALAVSPDVARERARRIGAKRLLAEAVEPEDPDLNDPARAPLPAGHPRAWGLLTAGTLLMDEAWPGYKLEYAA